MSPKYTNQRYESEEDRERQKVIATFLASKVRAVPLELHSEENLDYILYRPQERKVICFLECKRRFNKMEKYPDYMIDLAKLEAARSLLPIRSYVAVWWDDMLGTIELLEPDRIKEGGRKDRGDEFDVEPCAFYDINDGRVTQHGDPAIILDLAQ